MNTTSSSVLDAPARPSRNFVERLFRDTAYSLTAFPIGVLTFTLVVTGLSLGVSLAIVWVGVPILVGTLLVSRGVAHLERIRLRTLQGRTSPTPEYVTSGPDASWVRKLLTPMRDPQSWVDTAWGVAGFVTGTIAFVVTVTWWAVAAGGLTYWFWQQWIPEDGDNETLASLIGLGDGRNTEIWLQLGIGVVALLLLPLVVRAVTLFHAGLADAMLSGQRSYRPESTPAATTPSAFQPA
jgi:hypothetical protein